MKNTTNAKDKPNNFFYFIRQAIILFIIAFMLGACISTGSHQNHKSNRITESEYYIVFLVAAQHLNYRNNQELARSLIQYSRRKEGIGHSWVYVKGIKDGAPFVMEGGQSGQLGKTQPRFFKGVNNYIKYGYADPSGFEKRHPRYEPDPIKYLWEDLNDGFFQKGSGGHSPTYAAKIDITRDQFNRILDFIDPDQYPYESFSLVGNQCSSFVAGVASMAGLELDHQVTVQIDPVVSVGNREYRLWTDPKYSRITFSSPDVLGKSLMKAVSKGRAEDALDWYYSR